VSRPLRYAVVTVAAAMLAGCTGHRRSARVNTPRTTVRAHDEELIRIRRAIDAARVAGPPREHASLAKGVRLLSLSRQSAGAFARDVNRDLINGVPLDSYLR